MAFEAFLIDLLPYFHPFPKADFGCKINGASGLSGANAKVVVTAERPKRLPI